jgi:hypothetical protein
MHNNNYVRNLYLKYHLEISLCPNYEYDKQTKGRFPKWGGVKELHAKLGAFRLFVDPCKLNHIEDSSIS